VNRAISAHRIVHRKGIDVRYIIIYVVTATKSYDDGVMFCTVSNESLRVLNEILHDIRAIEGFNLKLVEVLRL
jgi:hypothetical protein